MAPIGPIRALVVEDNPGDATLTRYLLAESFGSPVQTSCVGWLSDAVRCLEHQTFDVVILDLVLPDADGLEGLRQIIAVVPQIPVVILSGLEDEQIAREALDEGAQEFLVKGSARDTDVGRAVEQAICRRRTETTPPRYAVWAAHFAAELAGTRTTQLINGDDVISSAQPAEILVINAAGATAADFAVGDQADCFVLYRAFTLEAAKRALARRHYDAILLNLELPDAWATDVYKTLLGATEDTPIVVLASWWTDPPGHLAELHRPFAIVPRDRSVPDLLRRLLISATLRKRALDGLSEAALDNGVPPQPPNTWRH
jgi:DNA-binding NarL/FixJ family response regulator